MKALKVLVGCVGIVGLIAVTGYWYVVTAGAPQLDAPQPDIANLGITFQLKSFNSQAMGKVRSYGVILPPNYAQHPQQRYPVIFLLHGGHDDARSWVDKYQALSVLHHLYKSHKLPPSIVITPDGNDQRGSNAIWDPQYYDGPNGKVGTLIGSELVQRVKSQYRVLDEPQFWAIGGNSSGGWGALNIGLHYVDNFHVLFSHSGYFTDKSGPANSPQVFVHQLPVATRHALRVYLDAGQEDRQFVASTEKFHQTLNQLQVPHVFYLFPGGHGIVGPDRGWNYWHKHLANSLNYVGQQFKLGFVQQKYQARSQIDRNL